MRKAVLTMYEDYQYQKVKNCVDQNGNFKRLCCQLHCSQRTGRRKMAGYKLHGKAFFRHKNHFHKPASAIPESLRSQILQIYHTDYYDANFLISMNLKQIFPLLTNHTSPASITEYPRRISSLARNPCPEIKVPVKWPS